MTERPSGTVTFLFSDIEGDCIPSYDAEVARDGMGSWTVVMTSHGDPPCAFEE